MKRVHKELPSDESYTTNPDKTKIATGKSHTVNTDELTAVNRTEIDEGLIY